MTTTLGLFDQCFSARETKIAIVPEECFEEGIFVPAAMEDLYPDQTAAITDRDNRYVVYGTQLGNVVVKATTAGAVTVLAAGHGYHGFYTREFEIESLEVLDRIIKNIRNPAAGGMNPANRIDLILLDNEN